MLIAEFVITVLSLERKFLVVSHVEAFWSLFKLSSDVGIVKSAGIVYFSFSVSNFIS